MYLKITIRVAELIVVLALIATVFGCAVGPDFHHLAAPATKSYTRDSLPSSTASADVAGGNPQSIQLGAEIPGEWWTLFHSAQLNGLIEQALKANPTLQAAKAALRQADENAAAEGGYLYPSVGADVSGIRQRRLAYQKGTPHSIASPYTLMNASVSVSYTFDVFGGTRRQIEAYQAQSEYQLFQLEAAYLTLTANVVTSAVGKASLRDQIMVTNVMIKNQRELLEIVRNEFTLGGASEADVLAQQTLLAQTESTLPPLNKQLQIERDLLRILTGHFPSQDVADNFSLSALRLPESLPLSLPSQLVEQRPDVRGSEAIVHQASAEIGVATANMLPQFTISGSLGDFVGSGLNPAILAFSVMPQVSQPIFEGGTLLHRKRAAVAAYEQALAEYHAIVLTAFQNVADTLYALQSDAEWVRAQTAAATSASESLRVAKEQYQSGYIPYPTLVTAEDAYQQTTLSLVQAEASRYADTAALFQSLGGGWWNRTDVAATDRSTSTSNTTSLMGRP